MNKINEIGDTPKGQEMLGRTAERAYQRAQRTSGADKKRFMRTYNDAYKTGGKSSNKHLGGSREHFDNGRDYEYEKWADEHNGNVAESKTMNKKLIRLTESDLHRIVKESVNRILREDLEGNELRDYVDSLHLNDNVPNERGIFHEYDPNLYGAGHGGEWYYRYGRDGRKYDVRDKWIPRVDDNGNEIYDHLGTTDRHKPFMSKNDALKYFHGDGEFRKDNNFRRPYSLYGNTYRDNLYWGYSEKDGEAEKDLKAFNDAEAKRNAVADKRWMKAADSRPLYRKNSPNNDIPR